MNGRFDAIQAAVITVKLKYFPEEVALREKIGKRYSEKLQGCCVTPFVENKNTSTYAIYTIRHPERDGLAKALNEKGIPTGVYYPYPIFHHPPLPFS